MSPSRPCVPMLCPFLAWLLGLLCLAWLSACGSPTPEAPLSGQAKGAADMALSAPARDKAGDAAGPAPTQAAPRGLTKQHAATPGARATSPASDARAQAAPARADPAPANSRAEGVEIEEAQRQAWDRWYAEARESPEAGMRLYALEVLAQQPKEALDPVTFALVDEDEQVRTRAQELYDQQLTREATRVQPLQEEGQTGETRP